jgi:hypothetical protein
MCDVAYRRVIRCLGAFSYTQPKVHIKVNVISDGAIWSALHGAKEGIMIHHKSYCFLISILHSTIISCGPKFNVHSNVFGRQALRVDINVTVYTF